ncbi:MAG TPA: GrpB family protein [Phycisphaerae bacterium]|nr:GrpB family protein [Phycisphaerae bacterium]
MPHGPEEIELQNDAAALGLEPGIVRLVDYNPRWPGLFEAEAARLRRNLEGRIGQIEHIGSTAIPGMPAKPVLDMMASVQTLRDAEQMVPDLEAIGYAWSMRDMQDVPDRRYFVRRREDGATTHHLSLSRRSSGFWQAQLAFRDRLCTHPDTHEAYARLKQDLARRFSCDRHSYVEEKGPFVAKVVKAATAMGRARTG